MRTRQKICLVAVIADSPKTLVNVIPNSNIMIALRTLGPFAGRLPNYNKF